MVPGSKQIEARGERDLKLPNTMGAELAKRFRVPLDEIRCMKTDAPVDPMIRRGVIPSSVWHVEFEAPDWHDPITIQVRVNKEILQRRIMRGQTLAQLEKRLNDIPCRDDETEWFSPGGLRVNDEITFHEWHNDDILTIVRRTEGRYLMHMTFQHDTMVRSEVQIRNADREAREWVEQVWGISKNMLLTRVCIDEAGIVQVWVSEQLRLGAGTR
jgi:hypothetical protein